MFQKFRNRFLMLNMFIISVVMLSAFIGVYLSFHNNIEKVNRNKLDNIALGRGYTIKTKENILDRVVPTDYAISFSVVIDLNGNVKEILSLLDMSEEDYFKLANTAYKNQDDYSKLKLNGYEWMYRITNIVPDHRYQNIYDSYIRITFMEVSSSQQVLSRLLINFVAVAVLMLFAIYLISLYFAQKAVKPILNAWNKQKEFIADASHELKTPLTIINTNIDALKANQKSKNKEEKKWLDYIQNQSNRMNKLVSDLLYLAKTEDLDMRLENFPFAISDVTNEIIEQMKTFLSDKKIKLDKKIENGLICNADEARVKQVMIILIENAIKYTDESGQININLKKNNKLIEFSVENTGEGIKCEDLPKVFDRFYRSDKARTGNDNSYGLGLSIAKAIIEKMNGKINVESTPNKTTKFTIVLKNKSI